MSLWPYLSGSSLLLSLCRCSSTTKVELVFISVSFYCTVDFMFLFRICWGPQSSKLPVLQSWWRETSTHQFTVKSSYNLLFQDQSTVDGDWKMLWGWRGPHRIQTFMWLVAFGRILTNYRRSRWRTGVSPACPCYGNVDEIVLHALCDSRSASHIWIRLVPSDLLTNFFSFIDYRDWVFKDLSKRSIGIFEFSWQTTFMKIFMNIITP